MIWEQMVTGIAETVLEDIETLEGIDTYQLDIFSTNL